MADAVLRWSLRRVAALRLTIEADRALVTALRAALPGPSRALLGAGADAGLDPEQTLDRATAAFLIFAAYNLSDDLSDGECDYLSAGEGPAVLLLVHGLALAALHDLGLPGEVHHQIVADLFRAEEAQVLEVRTQQWDRARWTTVADGIAGAQWAAYLRLMWAGTALADQAPAVARSLGRVALLAGDIVSQDRRWTDLTPPDGEAALDDALEHARLLRATGLAFVHPTLDACEPVLERHRSEVALVHPACGSRSVAL